MTRLERAVLHIGPRLPASAHVSGHEFYRALILRCLSIGDHPEECDCADVFAAGIVLGAEEIQERAFLILVEALAKGAKG